MAKRKALVIYGSITGNTQLVAKEFGKVLTENGFEAEQVKIDPKRDWDKDPIFVEDYDLVCLGSPIVGGFPLQAVIKAFSFGAGGALEKEVQNNLDSNKADAAAPAKKPEGAEWRRTKAPSPGMANHQGKRPYGIVFTTYGGGFYGVDEATCTLETLKLYLKLNNVDVIGRFSCGGKETGPAGYPLGVKPKKDFVPGKKLEGPDADVCDAVLYTMGDGTQVPGSYFVHYDNESKPGPREQMKAKAFIADIIEDFFMTYDGVPNPPLSEIVSLS